MVLSFMIKPCVKPIKSKFLFLQKRVGTNLSQLLKSDQILKYLELNPNLMLTDYLNFVWVGKDE